MKLDHKTARRATEKIFSPTKQSSKRVYHDPEPPGVPANQGREGESDMARAFRRFPITSHKPG